MRTKGVEFDLKDDIFGMLTVIEYRGEGGWLCKCECGNETIQDGYYLRKYKDHPTRKQCCGCLTKELHGMTDIPEYKIWMGMRDRCNNSEGSHFKYYGARGIKVCDEWNKWFSVFIEDMGVRPSPELSIDRVDNNGNYSCGHCEECLANDWPANCRWATKTEQQNNRNPFVRKNKVKMLTLNGKTQKIREWGEELGILEGTIYDRLYRGWSVEQALMTPVQSQFDSTKGKKNKE